jgi:hypothetical protein
VATGTKRWYREANLTHETSNKLQTYLMDRLMAAIALREEVGSELSLLGLRLVDYAIYSHYCECLDAGIGDRARELLHFSFGTQLDPPCR